jgi:hypothetical protein
MGAGASTTVPHVPGPVYVDLSLWGQQGFAPVRSTLPVLNTSLFSPNVNGFTSGLSICLLARGTIDCAADLSGQVEAIGVAPVPEPSGTGLIVLGAGLAATISIARPSIAIRRRLSLQRRLLLSRTWDKSKIQWSGIA